MIGGIVLAIIVNALIWIMGINIYISLVERVLGISECEFLCDNGEGVSDGNT